jgi:hypothetical protein
VINDDLIEEMESLVQSRANNKEVDEESGSAEQ